ncbi:3'(2'),5'-bisphosphate nucleotidase CysQ [Malikia sp.]|uniref:3'(2'),5'-bisphosphate nucleotidase CysQ n=1 Tax=Malikia sp. TaxID=2070706 RepID=UPI002606E46E|nr:3'(2'),5'-bisphosphate nucleotidase CysQ [Malikia sp.]MDD2728483.1 3'(2'),5'-bisphosphate nucleotidase CysQ [Malikia sp.]
MTSQNTADPPARPGFGELLESVATVVLEAGRLVMAVYARDFAVAAKDDASPVTEADQLAEALITPVLLALLPGVAVVAEEAAAAGQAPAASELGPRFWLVDPLDGTREFIQRNGEFTVNVALIEHGRPVLGVVLAPALGQLYAGAAGLGAFTQAGDDASTRQAISCRAQPAEGLTVLASRSHGDQAALNAYLAGQQRVARIIHAGSSLKLCLLAAGEADLYPRLGRTMEWDIAAGQAVLEAAGGRVEDLQGQPLRHGKPGFENPNFAAWGRAISPAGPRPSPAA